MTVTTIRMNKADATAAFREYQAAVRADRPGVRKVWKAEDLALMQAYKHLARGTAVIDLQSTMSQAGGERAYDVIGHRFPVPVFGYSPFRARARVRGVHDGSLTDRVSWSSPHGCRGVPVDAC